MNILSIVDLASCSGSAMCGNLRLCNEARNGQQMTERELVEGCLREEPHTQRALYDRYAPRMYAVCMRYARHELEAQDLMQDGFIKVFDKLGSFRFNGSLEGWVRRIMVHNAISTLRKKSHKMEMYGLETPPDEPVEPDALSHLGEQDLLRLIQDLPDGYRMVFNMYAIEGYDHKEIAKEIGCGESTSRSQLAKARKMLQQRILELQRIAS